MGESDVPFQRTHSVYLYLDVLIVYLLPRGDQSRGRVNRIVCTI